MRINHYQLQSFLTAQRHCMNGARELEGENAVNRADNEYGMPLMA